MNFGSFSPEGFRGELRRSEPMARHTTWMAGGPADLFLLPQDEEDLSAALRSLELSGIPWLPLGGGSNLLVRDGGIRGAVIDCRAFSTLQIEGRLVRAGAGLSLARLIRETADAGLGGLEELWGIPGTVGGAVAGNAGAGAQEIGQSVRSLKLCSASGCTELPAKGLRFGYRTLDRPKGTLIARVSLELLPDDPKRLRDRMDFWGRKRRDTQESARGSAGSVFKNPPGQSAWRLIDEAGCRGLQCGGAQVSMKHTNFILNSGSATAADIETLIQEVARRVFNHCGTYLETEVRIWGEPLGGNAEQHQGAHNE